MPSDVNFSRMTTLKKVLLPIAVIAVAAVISITITILRPAPLKLEAPDTAVAVKTLILFSQSADLLVESQGTVLPRTKTKMISEVSGAVLSLSPEFVVGGTFAAGDILLQLDPTDYEVALQRAEARLISMNAQATFELARGTQAQKEWAMTGRPTDEAPLLALREPYEVTPRLCMDQGRMLCLYPGDAAYESLDPEQDGPRHRTLFSSNGTDYIHSGEDVAVPPMDRP